MHGMPDAAVVEFFSSRPGADGATSVGVRTVAVPRDLSSSILLVLTCLLAAGVVRFCGAAGVAASPRLLYKHPPLGFMLASTAAVVVRPCVSLPTMSSLLLLLPYHPPRAAADCCCWSAGRSPWAAL